jgi:ketosteroid isomerase-like protein
MATQDNRFTRRAMVAATASSIVAAAGAAHAAMAMPADDTSLAAAIEQSHRALRAILNGDPTLYEALFAERDDITLGNPFGPYARGKAAVSKTLAGAAAKYRDGEVVAVDAVATYANGNIACVVEVEHDRAKVGASTELAEFHVRVTSVYERLNGQWRLVHRHADPITTPRPAESVLGR